MKILLIGVQLTSLANFRGPLIRDLVAAGHEVVAVAPEPKEPWLTRLRECGARYVEAPLQRTGINPLADLALTWWLARLCRHEKPDVVLAFQAKAVIYGLPAAWLAGVKRRCAMIEGLGQAFSDEPIQGFKRKLIAGLLPALYKWSLKAAQLVFFLNPDDRAEFRARGIITKQHQAVEIPGIGVDLDHFQVQPLPESGMSFLMMARLLADKGVREYAEAARLVKARFPDAVFNLLGPFDSSPAGVTKAEVSSWKSVTYLGETPDVRPFLAGSHVFVLPTFYREGMPRSILEAMASGRAIVTTNVPGARATVVDGVNGFLVHPKDVAALAATLTKLCEQPELVSALGQASRKLAEEKFEVGRINRMIISAMMEQA